MNLSVKNQTLLFISLIFIVFSGIFLTIVYFQNENRLKQLEQENFENVKFMYKKLITKEIDFYTHRIIANINSAGIKEALHDEDRQKLYKLSLGRFKTLKNENENFLSMNFYTKEGVLLLKMNDESTYGENALSSFRMLQRLHASKNAVNGFELIEGTLAFRLLEPVFLREEYIGCMEFTIEPQYILNEMDYYYNIDGALFVQNAVDLEDKKKKASLHGLTLSYNVLDSSKLLNSISSAYNFEEIKKIKIDFDEVYSAYTFDIKDLDSNILAKIVFAKNISNEVLNFQNDMKNITTLLLFALVITLTLVNFGFNKSIKNLENNYGDITQYKNLIDENLMTLSTNLYGVITQVSDAFCNISKFNKDELVGLNIKLLLHQDVLLSDYNKILEVLKKQGSWSGEIQELKQDEHMFWVYANIQPKFKNNKMVGYDTVMHDITEKKMNEELMITDGLTHIYNRRYFNEIFPRMISSTKRDGGYLSLVMLDIDHFKEYNDTYGHIQGDYVLVEVAKVLKSSLNRPNDYCFRLGGEEFAILFKSIKKEYAERFVENIRQNIVKLNLKHEKNSTYKVVTASFGVVTLNADALKNWEDMYKQADDKMYAAKKRGRNTIEF
jgi:diguanylate cyclase (GGDEF)-like protein/PAS domain S-box-containing protein